MLLRGYQVNFGNGEEVIVSQFIIKVSVFIFLPYIMECFGGIFNLFILNRVHEMEFCLLLKEIIGHRVQF